MKSISLKLANQDRWSQELGTPASAVPTYFRTVQPVTHCNRVPRKGIYAYSFAQNASSAMPSGACNFTRIYNKDLVVTTNAHPAAQQGASHVQRTSQYFFNGSE